MPRSNLLLLLALLVSACGEDPAPRAGGDGPRDTTVAAAAERVVVLRGDVLRLEPDVASPSVLEVSGGQLLAFVSAQDGWIQVATWDDRRGWIPDSLVADAGLWAHYGEALGGISPVLLRPAYPVGGRRWAVEAPFHSPGFTAASTAWLLGDSARSTRVARIDTIENLCGEERHRFAVTAREAIAEHWPLLEAGVVAAPSGSRPTARSLAVGALEPTAPLVALGEEVAAALAPAGAGTPVAIEWRALGDGAAWAAFSWAVEEIATGQAQLAAAALFVRGPAGWETAGTLAASPSSAEVPTPAWRPVAAYATGTLDRASILLLETFEYEGARLDIWIESGERYTRLHRGYYWGC